MSSVQQQQQQQHQEEEEVPFLPWREVPSVCVAHLLRSRELGSLQRTSGLAGSSAAFARVMQERIGAWAEDDFVRQHASAEYANLQRAPRSTIAAAFSCDGQAIASTQ